MKILIVANHNKGYFVPFIVEQVDALKQLGVEIEYYGVHGKGIRGLPFQQIVIDGKDSRIPSRLDSCSLWS